MLKKETAELLNELKSCNNVGNYIKVNKNFLINCSLCEYLNQLLNKKVLPKAIVIKQAEMNEIYGYQIFSGSRTPSRDKLICLCIGMGLNLTETQETLVIGGYAPLYPKNIRDSIIIFGINNKQSVCQINNILFEEHVNTL